MKAVYASTVNHADPLAALAVGEQPEPQARPFWSVSYTHLTLPTNREV